MTSLPVQVLNNFISNTPQIVPKLIVLISIFPYRKGEIHSMRTMRIWIFHYQQVFRQPSQLLCHVMEIQSVFSNLKIK